MIIMSHAITQGFYEATHAYSAITIARPLREYPLAPSLPRGTTQNVNSFRFM